MVSDTIVKLNNDVLCTESNFALLCIASCNDSFTITYSNPSERYIVAISPQNGLDLTPDNNCRINMRTEFQNEVNMIYPVDQALAVSKPAEKVSLQTICLEDPSTCLLSLEHLDIDTIVINRGKTLTWSRFKMCQILFGCNTSSGKILLIMIILAELCGPGTSQSGVSTCTDCGAGTYSNLVHNTECQACPGGTSSEAGATECKQPG